MTHDKQKKWRKNTGKTDWKKCFSNFTDISHKLSRQIRMDIPFGLKYKLLSIYWPIIYVEDTGAIGKYFEIYGNRPNLRKNCHNINDNYPKLPPCSAHTLLPPSEGHQHSI